RRNRLILSERAAAREWRREQKEKLLSELQENEVRTGIVSSLCDFGAFVDLGGADGLIHLSELSWGRVAHPREVLSVGDEVQVYVLHIDRERRRIALSLKRLQPEPWSQIDERYEIGQLVQGTITKITNFGAFARLDGDVEGLIHISELSDQRIGHPREVVQEGQTLDLRVIRIDSARKRIGLSLRRVNDTEIEDYTWEPEGEVTDQGAPEEDASPQEPEQ
ncbi:MAG TPA: S1 RNA-binding domain-containing protein, partial [Anaerolineae bacterium]|nr:S1 RNA-binding domain-containing protein [Anaerolineae bacterium]